jgi:hypothetical protein
MEGGMAGEYGDDVGDGEEPSGTHGSAYYAPSAPTAFGFGNTYDLVVMGVGSIRQSAAARRRESRALRPAEQQCGSGTDSDAPAGLVDRIPRFTKTTWLITT